MKKFYKILALALSASVLTACTEAGNSPKTEEYSEQIATETEYDVIFTPEDPFAGVSEDISAQMKLITARYDYLLGGYNGGDVISDAYFAVTDLNHNGRLEILISWCQGSGAFSSTLVYEVTEAKNDLVRLNPDDDSKNDDSADFITFSDGEPHVAVYDCYKNNGEYFYLITDYCSAGWTDKYLAYYAYSFDSKFRSAFIGSCYVSAKQQEKTVSVWLFDPDKNCFRDGSSFENYMKSYWTVYEEQKSCEVSWFPYSQKADFSRNVIASYKAFNPESDKKSDISYDFHKYFDCFYADEYEYVIEDTAPSN